MSGGVWHLVVNVADDVTACCGSPVSSLPAPDGLTEDAAKVTCPSTSEGEGA